MSVLGSSETEIGAGLHKHRRKLTRPRRAIFEILASAEEHLTPAEIHRRARDKCPNLGLTTVYRTLELLTELGYVQRVHLASGCHSYASAGNSHGHHVVCSNCGRAVEFEDCDLDALIRSLQKKTGYEISVHVLEFMGLCPGCRTRRVKAEG